MVLEQTLTILFGTVIAIAIVLYTVRPRHAGASQTLASAASPIETISLPSQSTSDAQSFSTSTPEVTAIQPLPVEAPVEINVTSSAPVSTVAADVAAADSSDVAIPTADAAVVPAPTVLAASPAPSAPSAARTHRAPRRSTGATPRTHKPRAPRSTKTEIKKL